MGNWCLAELIPSVTSQFIGVTQNGLVSGSKTAQRPATNCADTRALDCSIWARRFSRFVISFVIATCKRPSNGTPTVSRTGGCAHRNGRSIARLRILLWTFVSRTPLGGHERLYHATSTRFVKRYRRITGT